MEVSEGRGEHSMLREGDSAREEYGDLEACRQLLSIRARLRNATICRVSETPCSDRPLSPGMFRSLDSANPGSETLSSSLIPSASESALGLSRRLAGAASLRRQEVVMIMERLYRDHPGAVWRRTSRVAIKAVEGRAPDSPDCAKVLIYGEISFIAFTKLLEMYAPRSSIGGKNDPQASPASPGFTFYDLGCGAGRPVFMASLLKASCVKSCGVEIIPSMHQMNKKLLQLYDVEVRKLLHPAKQAQNITFLCGDMLLVDWSDADIVFTNATCFDDILFDNLESRAANILKEGAIVIVVTRRFKSDSVWELVNQTERRMSWSPAVVSVYRKKSQTLQIPTTMETRE